ncbi:cytidylate kinase [Legionella geestiana]|uniref:Cytidylate kinase n=1 Tax=Legionella geestiana TaxID=45065 RepID=A0A0W0TNM3_9GAMM|nr:(d)CMP kinase [Legionella geestiana]KTC97117.1 cytidylate kinase [Legionella geestiana]QBS11472.1 (d)CMP kinase [Legionella geestiana]QDQ39032.1 (d)CMP kinase [Legionella geestiana]STX53865.1 cytidylate kinase [Legionella geestiana]
MSENRVPVITLDGPSGTGKGTLCHRLAVHLGWHLLDSGAIYRVLALAARRRGLDFNNHEALTALAHTLDLRFETFPDGEQRVLLEGCDVAREIREEPCGEDASKLAVIAVLRDALLARQRAFAEAPGLVTDGRDMGTVVFPNALLKVYLFAAPEERAKRRYFQLKEKGNDVSLAQVVEELHRRDARDMAREHAPLKPAADAVLLDTTGLTITQVFNSVLELLNKRL